jgi:hypothetical protein
MTHSEMRFLHKKMNSLKQMDWNPIYDSLDKKGYSLISGVLSREECAHLSGMYHDDYLYRNTINMQRYRFGKGEYKYFNLSTPPHDPIAA